MIVFFALLCSRFLLLRQPSSQRFKTTTPVPEKSLLFIRNVVAKIQVFVVVFVPTIMCLKNGFLVDLTIDKEKAKNLRLDRISFGDQWKGVDVLIFKSYHSWSHTGQ
ncbi:hypothetical protein VIGAN_09116200 [Vigna angularis var. angularis]|uniref:Trichome birefringence-like C-terminal domain-containing protein n=1 Tax=Vigna angularis var. angularis TaxID=157739 RepID=A0A0S3SXP4_PHAAN|nr:hypothetical protein VIGAN_09116200 [Vigna angularis var. angularis]